MTSSTTEGSSPPERGPELLEVGRIVKPHGLEGEMVVELWSDLRERLAPGTSLSSESGNLVVVSSRPHQGRHLVRFAGVMSRTDAEALRGAALLAPPIAAEGVLWVHELVGAEVVDQSGRALGSVTAVEPNPASDLLVLSGGALVPLHFVTAFVPGARVTVDIPEGLVE